MRWVVVLLVCLWSSPVWAQEAPVEGEEARAQAQVEEARRLLKVRRFPEAIKLLEDAWLVLEDPELLRMLAEAHLEAGDRAAASHYRDEYLADPRVGESAKAAARERFAALAGEEEEEEGWGFTGWQSGGGGGGQAGGMYLGVMARLHYGEGGEFVGVGPRLEGQGEAPAGEVRGTWSQSGGGVGVELGYYVVDGLGVGVGLGLDAVLWQTQRPVDAFSVGTSAGWRPSLDLSARWFVGAGFVLGVSVGGDLVVFGEALEGECEAAVACPESGEGLQGGRLLVGGLAGYRAELSQGLSLGLDVVWRAVPVFWAQEGSAAASLPSYTEGAWALEPGVVLQWELP